MKKDDELELNAGETPSANSTEPTQNQSVPVCSEAYDFSKPVPPSDPVDLTYFDDAVFIGDSRTEGLLLNTGLSNAASFAHIGLMVDTVFTRPLFNVNGEKVPVIDAMKKAEFSKVYIMLGINETGWAYSSVFVKKYGEIVDAIREINPETVIYIQEIMPVSQKVSDTHSYVKNSKITEHNQLLRQLALRDWLGNDYRRIAAESIEETIAGWSQEQRSLLWDDLSVMDLISKNTDFYLNENGQAVVMIGRYEAACGSAGQLEFVIEPKGQANQKATCFGS